MFKKLFNKLFQNTTKSEVNNLTIPLNSNYILITSDADLNYEPHIKLHVVDLSDEACEKFTESLYHLNAGQYHQSFINLMLDMSHQDKDINKFIQSSIIYWSYLIKKNGLTTSSTENIDTNKPLVSPLDFNKNAKQ